MRVFTVILAVLGALVFAGLYGYVFWADYGLWALAIYAAMIAALPISSLLHESGHMLFGAICKIKAVPHFSLFGNSYCEIIPKTVMRLKPRIFFTVCGGLIVNMLLFLLGVLGATLGGYFTLLCIVEPANVFLFVMNVMPAEFASGKTDGLICNNLLNETDEAKVILAVLSVQAQIVNGKKYEELDEGLLFDLPQIREDDPSFIALCELRYKYCEAAGRVEDAEKYKTRFEQLKEEYN